MGLSTEIRHGAESLFAREIRCPWTCSDALPILGSRGREFKSRQPDNNTGGEQPTSRILGAASMDVSSLMVDVVTRARGDADHEDSVVWMRRRGVSGLLGAVEDEGRSQGDPAPDGAHAPAGIRASGRPVGWRDAMWLATCSASLPTPPISTEANAYWKYIPMKYRPGWDSTTPRSCTGSPSSLKTGRLIHRKSGANPAHQITFATSTICPPSRTGLPSRTPAVLGTSSTLAAVRSCRLIRARGMPLDRNVCCTFRPTGVRTVRTCIAANHIRGVTNLSGPLPGRTGSCPVSLPDSHVR